MEKGEEKGIHTEAQLAAAIEAGEWYDSDSEAENDNSEAGLSEEASSEEVHCMIWAELSCLFIFMYVESSQLACTYTHSLLCYNLLCKVLTPELNCL